MASPVFRVEALVIGFALLGIGVVWVLANTGRIDMLYGLRTYWPLTLVVWGIAELVNTYSARRS